SCAATNSLAVTTSAVTQVKSPHSHRNGIRSSSSSSSTGSCAMRRLLYSRNDSSFLTRREWRASHHSSERIQRSLPPHPGRVNREVTEVSQRVGHPGTKGGAVSSMQPEIWVYRHEGRTGRSLENYTVQATDGKVGKVSSAIDSPGSNCIVVH